MTHPRERGTAFGFLHALDIGGGMLLALAPLLFVSLRVPIDIIILFAVLPLVISTVLLILVQRDRLYPIETPMGAAGAGDSGGRGLLIALLGSRLTLFPGRLIVIRTYGQPEH